MSKRELIEPTPGDKRYVRRDSEGRFDVVSEVGEARSAKRPASLATRRARAAARRACRPRAARRGGALETGAQRRHQVSDLGVVRLG